MAEAKRAVTSQRSQRRAYGTGRVYVKNGLFWIRYSINGKRHYESTGSRFRYNAKSRSGNGWETPSVGNQRKTHRLCFCYSPPKIA